MYNASAGNREEENTKSASRSVSRQSISKGRKIEQGRNAFADAGGYSGRVAHETHIVVSDILLIFFGLMHSHQISIDSTQLTDMSALGHKL